MTLPIFILLCFALSALGEPIPHISPAISLPLLRRSQTKSDVEWEAWAQRNRDNLIAKYGGRGANTRRTAGTSLLTDANVDGTYYASVAIGTPPIAYNVILDTGSSDLWLASSICTVCTDSNGGEIPKFDPSSSSSFKNLSTPFQVTYGSGDAEGTLGQETVQMAGFQVTSQTFGVVNSAGGGILSSPMSGLMGLAWEQLASSRATPFWQTLSSSNAWTDPVMSFYMTRYKNATHPQTLEPGGQFTMGFVNSSLYTGTIDYQNIPSGQQSYWTLTISALTVQGNSITLGSNEQSAAIDTGTTLIAGPADAISQIYANIPGSAPESSSPGYYTYPCSTNVDATISFGGPAWTISSTDLAYAELSGGQCVGAFFVSPATGGSAPAWIIGDTFLKNVYSVFRYNPPSVGFAALSAVAIDMNGVSGSLPSATIGSPAAAVTATGSSGSNPFSSPFSNSARRWTYSLALVSISSLLGSVLSLL